MAICTNRISWVSFYHTIQTQTFPKTWFFLYARYSSSRVYFKLNFPYHMIPLFIRSIFIYNVHENEFSKRKSNIHLIVNSPDCMECGYRVKNSIHYSVQSIWASQIECFMTQLLEFFSTIQFSNPYIRTTFAFTKQSFSYLPSNQLFETPVVNLLNGIGSAVTEQGFVLTAFTTSLIEMQINKKKDCFTFLSQWNFISEL